MKVIIIGDHSYPSKILNNTKIYNRFINSNLNIYRDEMNHFDIFPTILDLMSIPYKKKAGLGYSIMRKNNELNYTAYKKLLMNNLEKKSDFYYEFWK